MTRRLSLLVWLPLTLSLVPIASAFDWEYQAMDGIWSTCIEVDPVHERLFVGTIEGFHYLDLPTGVWTERDWEGWIGRHVHSIDWHPTLGTRVITGRQNAFFKGYIELSDDLGATEQLVYNSNGGGVTDLHHDSQYYYACTWPDVGTGEFVRSADGGATWTLLPGHGHFAMTALEVDPAEVLYLAGDNRVTRSFDSGQTWDPLGGNLPPGLVHCVIWAYPGGDVIPEISLLAGNDLGLYFSWAAGQWEQVLADASHNIESIPVPAPWPGVPDNLAVVTADGRLLYSRNFGDAWDDETGNLPGDAVDVVYSDFDNALYVCTQQDGVYRAAQVVTAVGDEPVLLAAATLTAWPNPFNPRVQLVFEMAKAGEVTLAIFDLKGRRVATLASGRYPAGEHRIDWRPRDLSSGVYLARLEGPFGTRTARLMLLK